MTTWPVVRIVVNDYGRDRNGNAIGRHSLLGYDSADLLPDCPTEVISSTRTRQQIGYQRLTEQADSLLASAGLRGYTLTELEGSCAEGRTVATYTRNC
jgi:hypothetical protein